MIIVGVVVEGLLFVVEAAVYLRFPAEFGKHDHYPSA